MALKIRYRTHRRWSPPKGEKQVYSEWQVVEGRRVVARFDFEDQAQAYVAKREGD